MSGGAYFQPAWIYWQRPRGATGWSYLRSHILNTGEFTPDVDVAVVARNRPAGGEIVRALWSTARHRYLGPTVLLWRE